MSSIPDGFGPEFLDWFRVRTEAYWANLPEATPEEALAKFIEERVRGCSWQRATKWLNGLSDQQIDMVEARWNLRFPPDYQLFLRRLYSVDKPMLCTGYLPIGAAPGPGGDYVATMLEQREGQYLALVERPSFYHWTDGEQHIGDALEQVVYGLIFDVEYNNLWPESWGTKPNTADEREQHVRALVADAPKLIPVFGHRFLLAEPCQVGNPVFSIMQSDIIIYGADLRDYFLIEFADELLALSPNDEVVKAAKAHISNILRYESIPFWGELLFI